MNDKRLGGLVALGTGALFVGGLILQALFVLAAGRGLMAIANARTFSSAADDTEDTLRSARKAVKDLRQRNEEPEPDEDADAEIYETIRLENAIAARREAEEQAAARHGNGRGEWRPDQASVEDAPDITTGRNEEIEDRPPIPADSFYVREPTET